MKEQERLIKEIKGLSDSIRKKNRKLKMGISEREKFIESTFKPVIQPLKEISHKLNNVAVKEADMLMPIKQDKDEAGGDEGVDSKMEVEEKNIEDEEDDEDEDDEDEEDESENVRPTEESNLTLLGRNIGAQGELYKKYVLKMLHGATANRKHHVYGARLEKNGLMVGNKELVVDENDNIIIGGKTYPSSIGLFELIFKKLPTKFSSQDQKWFKEICITTNAHKKNYLSSAVIHRNATKKYKDVIAKLFPTKSGSGLTSKNTKKPNIIYYNNVNKLVERLQLLHEAKQSGHTGLHNEIVALTEELRQRGYIK